MAATHHKLPDAACSNCRFWIAHRCHRNAPVPGAVIGSMGALWHKTDPTDWCGEHRRFVPLRPADNRKCYDRDLVFEEIRKLAPSSTDRVSFTQIKWKIMPKFGMSEGSAFKILKEFVRGGRLAKAGYLYHISRSAPEVEV